MTDDPEIAAMKSALAATQGLLGASRVPSTVFEGAFRDGWAAALLATLPVVGYRPQSDAAVALVNEFKADEERLLRKLDKMMQSVIGRPMSNMSTAAVLSGDATVDAPYDPRWVAIARTHFQEGFMALNRAVFQPGRVKLPEDES